MSSTGPDLPHAEPGRVEGQPPLYTWHARSCSPSAAHSLLIPAGVCRLCSGLSVWSHQWGAPAGGVQDREGGAEVVTCLADSLVTLDWLYLTFSLFLHSRKILPAPGPLHLLLLLLGTLSPILLIVFSSSFQPPVTWHLREDTPPMSLI